MFHSHRAASKNMSGQGLHDLVRFSDQKTSRSAPTAACYDHRCRLQERNNKLTSYYKIFWDAAPHSQDNRVPFGWLKLAEQPEVPVM